MEKAHNNSEDGVTYLKVPGQGEKKPRANNSRLSNPGNNVPEANVGGKGTIVTI